MWIHEEQRNLILPRITNIVAEIASLHTSDFLKIIELDQEMTDQVHDLAHPRFIATLLRLGDALDLDNNRFDIYALSLLGKTPKTTQTHLGKHQSITHLLVTPEKIEIKADCSEVEIYFELRNWINGLDTELDNSIIHWVDIAPEGLKNLPRANSEIKFKGRKILEGFENIIYSFSQNKMFEIIKGGNIYDSDFIFLREFLQNALDASKIKLWKDLKNGLISIEKSPEEIQPWDLTKEVLENYLIKINISAKEIEENQTHIAFSITDSGTGFSTEDIKRIANIGNSWLAEEHYRLIINEMPNWLRPTGSFGIGMQSAFLCTNEIDIITTNEKNHGIQLKLRSNLSGKENIIVTEAQVPTKFKIK